ncbi:MAG: tetratricopeptide repeat protein [Shewanella sp.]|uniref:tetratricopeptide repeat protein n=1 Tax=Shewanella xiamenensis TaxID=332186 RepID=UPI00214F72C4|nr:tetratricopeptide repeat protein [Shewanella xiamenensis]MCR4534408.1 sel1 repeat family protein [Shewanella xiamenensis]
MLLILIIIAFIVLFVFFAKYQKKKIQAEALAAGEPSALLNHGLTLINQGEVNSGLDYIQQAVDKGFAVAAIAMAELYSGRFPQVPADIKASNDWYRKAAEIDPQYLPMLTLTSLVATEAQTPEQLREQVEQLKTSAEAGQVEFQYELAYLYLRQPFLDPDASQAIYWFEKAIAQGNQDAYYHLGTLYLHDERVTSDYVKAREYFEKAVAAGDELAKDNLGHMLAAGQGGPKDLVRAETLLSEYAAEDHFRQYYLGKRFLYGEDFAIDYDKARHWLEKSCAAGNDYAKLALAELKLLDPQNDQDYLQAKAEFEANAPLWHTEALFGLGKIYEEGLGISRQPIKALMYYQLAAMSHDQDYQAAYDRLSKRLGTLEIREAQNLCNNYLHQYPIPDEQLSYYHFSQAALFHGEENPSREGLQTAETWYRKSADLGNQNAMQALVEIYRHELMDKPVQAFIWSSILLRNFGKYGMNSDQLLYQQQAQSRLTESELLYAQSEIERIEALLAPYLETHQ